VKFLARGRPFVEGVTILIEKNKTMRTILLSTLGAIVLLAVFSSCSTTVRTDNGHAVTTGVHTH
jgi:hypothetical protein